MEDSGHKEFDKRTHIRNPKTGEVESKNHYTYHVSKSGEYYVRDKQKFHPNGEPMEEAKPEPEPKPEPVAEKPKAKPKKKPAKPAAEKAPEEAEDK